MMRRAQESLKGRHHLLSTGRCAGVFRARYWAAGDAGEAIERKLRCGEDRGWWELSQWGPRLAAAGPPPVPRPVPAWATRAHALQAQGRGRG